MKLVRLPCVYFSSSMVTLRGGSTTDGGNGAVGSSVPRERHLVTGGGGYAGFHLGKALVERGHSVILLDVKEPAEDLPERTTFITVITKVELQWVC